MVDWSVYLVTQASRSAGRTTPAVVEAALAGGVGVVQLREKDVPARERYEVGKRLRDLTREADATLIVNDRVDLARAVDADGVHLGDDDLPVSAARDLLGPDAVIGRSVSFVDDAEAAEAAGADYLGVGAIYATDAKDDIPEDEHAVGPERLAAIADAVSIPVVGIGGITPENAADVVAAGADGVAVISAITAAEGPRRAARELGDSVNRGHSERDA